MITSADASPPIANTSNAAVSVRFIDLASFRGQFATRVHVLGVASVKSLDTDFGRFRSDMQAALRNRHGSAG
jgi:hypothetical protein